MPEELTMEEFQKRYGGGSQPSQPESLTPEEFAKRYNQPQKLSVAETAKQRLLRMQSGQDLPPGYTPESLDDSFGRGLAKNLIPTMDGLRAAGRLAGAEGPVQQVKGLYNVGKNAVNAGVDQAKKGWESASNGDNVEALGHYGAALLPIVGPAAAEAGEKIKSGNIKEGLGEGVGLVGSMVLPEAVGRATSTATPAVANFLERSGVKQYASALGGKYSKAAKDVAKELIDRRVRTTNPKENLTQFAESKASAIDTDALAATQGPMDVNAALQRLEDAKAKLFRDNGGVMVPKDINSERIAAGLDEYADLLKKNADPNGQIPMQDAIDLRQTWSQGPGDRKLWLKDNPLVSDAMQVRMDAAQSLGSTINDNPAIKAANKEKSFWLKTKNVAEAAPANKPLASGFDVAALGASGLAHAAGIPFGGIGAIIGGVDIVKRILASPAYRTSSAVLKGQIADLLRAGDYGAVTELATRNGLLNAQQDEYLKRQMREP